MKRNNLQRAIYLMALLLFTCGAALAQTRPDSNLTEAKKAIAASNAIYFDGFAKNDPTLFTIRYSGDCWIMPPNAASLCGPDAAAGFFKAAYDMGVRNGTLTTIDVYGISDDVVAEIGFFRLMDADWQQFDDGKYLVLWKKTKEGWKMFRDSFNSDHTVKN